MVADNLGNQAIDNNKQGFLKRLTTARKKIPLRTVLIVPFVLQIFGTVSLVGYLSFRNSQEAVNGVVSELRNEISNRIEQHLKDYLKKPHLINHNNLLSNQTGLMNLNNQDTVARQFWEQRQVFGVNAVYFGNTKGGYVGAEPGDTITITENFLPGQYLYYNTNDKGLKVGNPKLGKKYFDSRTRPWYQVSENKKGSRWSDIYTYDDGSDIAIAATRPLYNNGKFEGVLGTDISLEQINKFLNGIRVGKTGQVFILERDGLIVGSSTKEKIYYKQGNKIERLSYSYSISPLVRESIKFL